ncbi:MAG TPA: DUF2780 domain-containing protein [Terriglobia bacterium]|nr:DUF2780 domain-containing protein [Terriglobia bacterium]
MMGRGYHFTCALILAFLLMPSATVLAQAKLPNPELAGMITKELKITPQQATGGAGALFGLAKTRLKPEDFSKVSAAVPGMDGLLKAAPKASSSNLGSLGSAPGQAGALGALAGQFKKLGLSPDMVAQFVPILTKFTESKGGAGVASILAGALK